MAPTIARDISIVQRSNANLLIEQVDWPTSRKNWVQSLELHPSTDYGKALVHEDADLVARVQPGQRLQLDPPQALRGVDPNSGGARAEGFDAHCLTGRYHSASRSHNAW